MNKKKKVELLKYWFNYLCFCYLEVDKREEDDIYRDIIFYRLK